MSVDFGRRTVVWRGGSASARLDVRALSVVGVLALVAVGVGMLALTIGSVQLSIGEIVAALTGTGDERSRMLVVEWRLPRLLFAVLAGIALASSGAVFQSITRNPLGSPDVIGLDAGSFAGATITLLILGTARYVDTAIGATVGGLVTAVVVYFLAVRRGVSGFRLIIVGIAVGSMLVSFTSYLLLRAERQVAASAAAWAAGSFSSLGFEQVIPFAIAVAVVIAALVPIVQPLGQLELGDDASRATGVGIERVRLYAIVVGVALTALVTAAAGPIPFIALVAPQVAARLTRRGELAILPAALTGAALLLVADAIAQLLYVSTGLVTVSLGGLFFAWLLVREYRHA